MTHCNCPKCQSHLLYGWHTILSASIENVINIIVLIWSIIILFISLYNIYSHIIMYMYMCRLSCTYMYVISYNDIINIFVQLYKTTKRIFIHTYNVMSFSKLVPCSILLYDSIWCPPNVEASFTSTKKNVQLQGSCINDA